MDNTFWIFLVVITFMFLRDYLGTRNEKQALDIIQEQQKIDEIKAENKRKELEIILQKVTK